MTTIPSPSKLLRIGLIQGGVLVRDELVEAGRNVTIGSAPRCTLSLAGVGRRHTLLEARGGRYLLKLDPTMGGQIASTPGQGGIEIQPGGACTLPVDQTHRGKIRIAEATVLFQFVTPPPVSARVPIGRSAFRPKLIAEDDPIFLGLLSLFTAAAAVAMIYVYSVEPVELIGLEQVPDRFVQIMLPDNSPLPPVPEVEAPKKQVEEPDDQPLGPPERTTKSPGDRELEEATRILQRKADLAKKSRLLELLMRNRGEDHSDLHKGDVFSDGDPRLDEIQASLEGVPGNGVAMAQDIRMRGGTDNGGRVQTGIGQLNRGGGGTSDLGTGPAVPLPEAWMEVGTVETVDPEVAHRVGDVLKSYRGQIQRCYEQRLKEIPQLRGRIAVEFDIRGGAVHSLHIKENTTHDAALAECVDQRIRGWRFPEDIDDQAYLPFALSPK